MIYEFTKKDGLGMFQKIYFVAQAVSSDKTKPALACILINDEHIVATDGCRLHLVNQPEYHPLEPGLYKVVKYTKTVIILNSVESDTLPDYPDYQKVLPVAEEMVVLDSPASAAASLAQVIRSRSTGAFDFKFFSDAFTFNLVTYYKQAKGEYEPLLLANEDYSVMAVVMPMRT